MNIVDLRSMTRSERAAWDLEQAEREFRLFATDDFSSQSLFDDIKTAQAAFYRTPAGVNARMAEGHTEKATATAIAYFGYDGNAAAVRARSNARKTRIALDEMHEVKEELVTAVGEFALAKQKRTKERAQGKIDDALARLSDLSASVREHAQQAEEHALAAKVRGEHVPAQASSAKRAVNEARRAAVKASLAVTMLDDARRLAAGESSPEEDSLLPASGEELLAEAELLDDADYDSYEEDSEVLVEYF